MGMMGWGGDADFIWDEGYGSDRDRVGVRWG